MQQVINILFAVPDFGGDLIVRIQLHPQEAGYAATFCGLFNDVGGE